MTRKAHCREDQGNFLNSKWQPQRKNLIPHPSCSCTLNRVNDTFFMSIDSDGVCDNRHHAPNLRTESSYFWI